MKSVTYLLQLQQQKKLTDTALGKMLGVTQPAISQYKSGTRIMDNETCLAIALELGLDPMQVIGAACLDRAEKTGQKSLWEVFMNRAAATAGAVLVASSVNVFLTPNPANAASMRVSDAPISNSIDYANYDLRTLGPCSPGRSPSRKLQIHRCFITPSAIDTACRADACAVAVPTSNSRASSTDDLA